MADLTKIAPMDMPEISAQRNVFVMEYVKDFNGPRAAERAGYSNPSYGSQLLEDEDVQALIHWYIGEMRKDAAINAEWVMWEAVDNHRLARQQGNLGASNAALKLIGTLATVDAFAASKVEITVDEEMVDRLERGRERARLATIDGECEALPNDPSFL